MNDLTDLVRHEGRLVAMLVTKDPGYLEALVGGFDAVYGGDEDETLMVEGRDKFSLDTLDYDSVLDEITSRTNIAVRGGVVKGIG